MTRAAQDQVATRPDDDVRAPALRLRSDAGEDRESTLHTPAEDVDQDMLVVQMAARAAAHGLESEEDREHRQEVERMGVQLLKRLLTTDELGEKAQAIRVLIRLQARYTQLESRRYEMMRAAIQANTKIRCAKIHERTAHWRAGRVATRPSASRT